MSNPNTQDKDSSPSRYASLNLKHLGALLNLSDHEQATLKRAYAWCRGGGEAEQIVDQNEAVCGSPNRLKMLPLIAPDTGDGSPQKLTLHCVELIERPHPTHASLLNGLLNDFSETSPLNDWQPLDAEQLSELVARYADWQLPSASFRLLAGRLTTVDVREALVRCAVSCCQTQTAIDEFQLHRALFAQTTGQSKHWAACSSTL